jgi:peroxiredoxin
MTLTPGTEAPDFTLKDQDANDVTLSSLRGNRNVVIVFSLHVHRSVPGRAVLLA